MGSINRVEFLYCKECVWSFWVCYGCIWHSKFITHISTQNLHLLPRKVVVHHLKPNDQPTQKGSFQAEGHRNKFCQDILMMPSFKRKKLVNWAQLRYQTLNKLTLGELHTSAIQPWLMFNFRPSPWCDPLVKKFGKMIIQAAHLSSSRWAQPATWWTKTKIYWSNPVGWLLIAPHIIAGISEFLVAPKSSVVINALLPFRTSQLHSLKLTWPRKIGRGSQREMIVFQRPTIPFFWCYVNFRECSYI